MTNDKYEALSEAMIEGMRNTPDLLKIQREQKEKEEEAWLRRAFRRELTISLISGIIGAVIGGLILYFIIQNLPTLIQLMQSIL